MSATGAIHPAILVVVAALLLVLSAALVFLRRKRTAAARWRALAVFGPSIRLGVSKRPRLAATCRAIGKRRWHLVCLACITVIAATWILSRDTEPETEIAIVGVVATDDPSAGAEGSFQVEIDPRDLARQDADARRIQQGIALLAVIGVLALVWVVAAKFAAAR